jgi:DNA-directed RNA polymerase specialized sigma24 family protein
MTAKQIEKVVRRVYMTIPWIELEDIRQEAQMLLLENTDMSALTLKCRLIDEFRTCRWQNSYSGRFLHTHRNFLIQENVDEPMSPSPEDAYIAKVDTERLMKRLTDRQREIITDRYWRGLNLVEISRGEGISKTSSRRNVNYIYARAIKEMCKAI